MRAAAVKRAQARADAVVAEVSQQTAIQHKAAVTKLKHEMEWARTDAAGKAEEAGQADSKLAKAQEELTLRQNAVKKNAERKLAEETSKAEEEYEKAKSKAGTGKDETAEATAGDAQNDEVDAARKQADSVIAEAKARFDKKMEDTGAKSVSVER